MKRIISFLMTVLLIMTFLPGEIVSVAAEEIASADINIPVSTTEDVISSEEVDFGEDVEIQEAENFEEFAEMTSQLIEENDDADYFSSIVIDPEENTVSVDGNETNQQVNDIVTNGVDESLFVKSQKDNNIEDNAIDNFSMAELEKAGCVIEETEGAVHITRPYQTKRLIVRTKNNALINTYGASTVISDGEGKYILQYNDDNTAKKAYEYIKQLSSIESVSVDSVVTISSVDFSSDNPLTQNNRNRWGVERIESDRYKQYLADNGKNNEVVVAVIDTGVEMNHPFIKDRLLKNGYDFVNNDNIPDDEHMHGTHCSGIIKDNTPDCVKILPIKVMNANGQGSESTIAMGIDYAVANGADIISMSLGGECNNDNCEINIAIRKATKAGILCVIAAGNESKNAENTCPARINECITVASLNENDHLSDFSNFGDSIDISAPGESIWSSTLLKDGAYEAASGTSMATPFVAASAAMLLVNNPKLSINNLTSQLKNAVVDLGVKGEDNSFGAGAIDFGVLLGDRKSAETIQISQEEIKLAYSKNYKSKSSMPVVTVLPKDATDKSYSYDIDDTSVVSYDGRNLNPRKIGETDIVFSLDNGSNVYCHIVSEDMKLWMDYAANSFAGGSGTQSDPYLIRTAEQLAYMSLMGYKALNKERHLYFKQIADIDLSGKTWYPIRCIYLDNGFNCVGAYNYDGNGYKISNLKAVDLGELWSGLFAIAEYSEFSNINLINADINCPSTEWVGGICGESPDYIHNCYVSGNIIGGIVGGITGMISCYDGVSAEDSLIMNCRSDANVKSISGGIAGGIVGSAINGRIENCVSTGEVSARTSGGIAGHIISVGGLGAPYTDIIATDVINCVSTQNVVGERSLSSDVIVIVIGDGNVEIDKNEYTSLITNCYYSGDFDSPLSNDRCDTPLVKVEKVDESLLKKASFYTDSSKWDNTKPWDTNYWAFSDGKYPTLKNQHNKVSNKLFSFKEFRDSIQVTGYYGTDPNVTVPGKINGKLVESVGKTFTSKNVEILSLTLPDTLKFTSYCSFGVSDTKTNTIQTLIFGKSIEIIDRVTVNNLSSLKSIVIPASVKIIAAEAFFNCDNLKYVFFEGNPPQGVEKAFKRCSPEMRFYYKDTAKGWTNSKYSTFKPTVYKPSVPVGLTFKEQSLELKIGSTGTLKYELYPSTADKSLLTFKSSDSSIIKVNSKGKYTVTAKESDSAVISVYYSKKLLGKIDISVFTAGIFYTIKFNANGGSGKMSKQKNVPYNGAELKGNKFKAPKGKVFGGWALSKKGEGVYINKDYVYGLTTKNGSTVNLYAVWVTPKQYSIRYYVNGGKELDRPRSTYISGKTSFWLPEPTRKGYTFMGWCRKKNLSDKPIKEIHLYMSGNLNLYAKWERNTYTVKFNANGGSGKMNKQTGFKYGKKKSLKDNTFTAPKGKVFAGWATKKNGDPIYTDGQKVKNLTAKNGKTVTLYAVWVTPKTYKIKYDTNGGKLASGTKKTYKSGTGYTLKKPTRKGYTFVGWYTDKKMTKNKITSIKPWETGTVKVYAKWKKNT